MIVRQLGRRELVRAGTGRLLLLSASWWVLAEGSAYNLIVAALVVLAATAASLAIAPPADWRLAPIGALLFAGYFVRRSFLAGLDVARRIAHPDLPIAPDTMVYRTALPPGAPRALFVGVVSLLPGTLSVHQDGDALRVHLLDRRRDAAADLSELESRVALVFSSRAELKSRRENLQE